MGIIQKKNTKLLPHFKTNDRSIDVHCFDIVHSSRVFRCAVPNNLQGVSVCCRKFVFFFRLFFFFLWRRRACYDPKTRKKNIRYCINSDKMMRYCMNSDKMMMDIKEKKQNGFLKTRSGIICAFPRCCVFVESHWIHILCSGNFSGLFFLLVLFINGWAAMR